MFWAGAEIEEAMLVWQNQSSQNKQVTLIKDFSFKNKWIGLVSPSEGINIHDSIQQEGKNVRTRGN